MLNNIIKNSKPLTMNQMLKHLDYGRKLRSNDLRSSHKNNIKVLVDKPNNDAYDKKSSFEYKGKKFIKTFFTYNVENFVKKTNYRVTLCVLNDKPIPTFNSAIQYYCGCPDFKFRMAYNLKQINVLISTKSTISLLGKAYTDAPEKEHTDSLMCKHCYSVFQDLKKNKKWEY